MTFRFDGRKGRTERDGVPYEQWQADKLVNVIDGPEIEPDVIEDHVHELCARFDVREIAFDPYYARMTTQHLHDDGLPAVEMRQNITTMEPVIADLERVVTVGPFDMAGTRCFAITSIAS